MQRPILLMVLAIALAQTVTARAQLPVEVEPADLAKRQDLIGKEVIVDDRVKLFYPHPGRDIDEIHLRRTPIIFRLPPSLRYTQAPSAKGIRIQAILRKSGDTLVCDVTEVPYLYMDDVKRLDLELARLKANDLQGRIALAEWATRRANAFKDDALLAKGEAIATEAFALEQIRAESSPEGLLVLARRARERKVPEPQPSALAHRALLMRLALAKTSADFDRLADDILAFFPSAKLPSAGSLPKEMSGYERDPGGFYRQADAGARASLDRKLWADAVVSSIKLRAAKSPKDSMSLADEAKSRLPDRPEIAAELRTSGYEVVGQDPTKLREDEIMDLVRFYREERKDFTTALAKIRIWLDDQKERLSPSDADGRIKLASQYLKLLADKALAADLLRTAEEIDPKDEKIRASVQDSFQRMGFHKVRGNWEPANSDAAGAPNTGQSGAKDDDPYIGQTAEEIRGQLGKPETVCRIASQGRISIQWIYRSSKGMQYIDFVQKGGEPQPTVVGRYTTR